MPPKSKQPKPARRSSAQQAAARTIARTTLPSYSCGGNSGLANRANTIAVLVTKIARHTQSTSDSRFACRRPVAVVPSSMAPARRSDSALILIPAGDTATDDNSTAPPFATLTLFAGQECSANVGNSQAGFSAMRRVRSNSAKNNIRNGLGHQCGNLSTARRQAKLVADERQRPSVRVRDELLVAARQA